MKLRDQDELFADETLYRQVERPTARPASVSSRERMLREQFDVDRPRWAGVVEEQPVAAGHAEVPPVIEEPETLPFYKRLFEHKFFQPSVAADPMKNNGRLYFAIVCFLFALLLVVGKLFKLQVLDHQRF